MVNVNSLPGPDKGLVDVIFGQQAVAAEVPVQAATPGQVAPQPTEMPADFQKLLAQAQTQDQKEAVAQKVEVKAPQTKDGKVIADSAPKKAKKTGESKEEELAVQSQAIAAAIA